MTITLNGQSRAFDADHLTVDGLLVEVDREAVFPADYDSTGVHDGASIEIVTIAAGG